MPGDVSDEAQALLRLLTDATERDPLDVTWLSLTSELLRFVRDNSPPAKDWSLLGGEPFSTIRHRFQPVISGALREADQMFLAEDEPLSAFPSRASLKALIATVRSELMGTVELWVSNGGSLPLHAIAVACAAANAIDELYGATFLEKFRSRLEVVVSPDQPYPVTVRNPAPWLGGNSANSPVRRLPHRDLAETTHLKLGPLRGPGSVRFVIDFQMWNRLGPFGASGELVVAVGQPNLTLDEFDIHVDKQRHRYRNGGPVDPKGQAARILSQIDAAADAGADLIVFSEYCLNSDTAAVLEERVFDLRRSPTLVVAGLAESDEEGELTSQAWLAVLGSSTEPPLRLHVPPKVSNAALVFEDVNAQTGESTTVELAEDIRTGHEVRVFVTRQWTLSVLICRDVLDQDVMRQLADIGVNLLIVPAMSARTASMLDMMVTLRATAQSFGVMANGPASWTGELLHDDGPPGSRYEDNRVEAAFVGPYAGVLDATQVAPPAAVPSTPDWVPDSQSRGLWLFRSKTHIQGWAEQ